MSCCPCCCENEELSIYCKTCGQNVCGQCFLTCEKCYDRFCIDCEERDFLCVDCLGEDAESVDEEEDEEDEEVDYSLFKPRELCYVIEDLKYKLKASEELSKEKDKQMEILREKIGLLEEQNKLLKEQLNKKLK
jgi:hypothetical protein